MPKSVLTRKRSWIARFAVLAVVFSLLAVALPASAHSVAIDTSTPCPAATPSAGFTDIGGFDATTQLAINCLFAFGITTGTSATTYSPNDTTTRWQMALFLVRQATDHGLTIPAAASQGYTDIGTLPQSTQDAINQITQLGVSKGTSTTTFSPFDGVSRWQMALFIYRLGVAAGVTFTNDSAHNEFTDIGGTLAEAQTAINALADAHVALGTGGSAFTPNLLLVRWQMALFLTRLLAADGIAAPAGLRVTVTPTDTVSQSSGTARAYTATFKNADGTAYTGAVGVLLRIVSSAGVVDWDGAGTAACPDDTTFEAPTDGLVAGLAGPTCGPSIEGFPGADGVVSFTVRHDGSPAERVVPVAWEDLDNDNLPEISGNNPPTEPYGVGGQVAFGTAVATECTGAPTVFAGGTVSLTDKAGDRFELTGLVVPLGASPCSIYYDSNDLFRIEGVATDLAGFEAALNNGTASADIVGGTYDSDTADQSTLDITTDNDASLTVTDPAAGGVTVDANTYTIKGTAVAGYTVRIYNDVGNDGVTDGLANSTTAAADGTWSAAVNLSQGAANDFLAAQRPTPGGTDGPLVDVPTITEGAPAGARLAAGNTWIDGVPDGILNPGDVITLNFNETVTAPTAGDTVEVSDSDATSVRVTCGNEATCTAVDTDTISVTVNLFPQILAAGATAGLQSPAQINVLGGFIGTDGLAVDVANSPAANRQLAEA